MNHQLVTENSEKSQARNHDALHSIFGSQWKCQICSDASDPQFTYRVYRPKCCLMRLHGWSASDDGERSVCKSKKELETAPTEHKWFGFCLNVERYIWNLKPENVQLANLKKWAFARTMDKTTLCSNPKPWSPMKLYTIRWAQGTATAASPMRV